MAKKHLGTGKFDVYGEKKSHDWGETVGLAFTILIILAIIGGIGQAVSG